MITLAAAATVSAVATPLYVWWHNRDKKAPLLQAASVVFPGLAPVAVGYSQYEALMTQFDEEARNMLGLYRQVGSKVELVGAVPIPPAYLEMIGRSALKGALNNSKGLAWDGVVEGWDYTAEDFEGLFQWLTENFMVPGHEAETAVGIIRLFGVFGKAHCEWATEELTKFLLEKTEYTEQQIEETIIIGLLSQTEEGREWLSKQQDSLSLFGIMRLASAEA